MIVGFIFLIQVVFADDLVCPAHIQGKSGGNLSIITKDFGPFDSKKCLLEQVGEPQNCKCEGQEKVFAESSLIDADNLYKQVIEEVIEDAYIKSYQSAIKRIFQGALAADVYLKDKKLKEEDLIRLNSCRPNAVFETIKELESDFSCGNNPIFKRRLAKFVGSRKMNLIEAEADKKDLAKKSINEIIESGKNAFYGQIIAVAQNVPTDPKYCVPYKAYLEFTKGDSPAGESWQDLTHPTNQSDYEAPEGFPFKGSLYQMDLYNSEDQIIKDYLSKGDAPSDDFGFMKGMDFDEPKADPKELIDNQIKREMRRIRAIERHPFLATILSESKLKEEYEKFVGNEDTEIASENGIIKDTAFMKKIMEVQNDNCKKTLHPTLIRKLLCDELPKPSKEVYAAKILPSLYRDRENYPLPGLSYALVKKYNDNYCPRKPSRPGAPIKTNTDEENQIEKVLSPLTSEMSGLELIDSPFANESGYAKFNEKMCSSMKKCGKSGKCDSGEFWGEDLASQFLDKISKEKLEELAKERGIDLETLKKQLVEALNKSLKSRIDDDEDELLAEVKDLVEEEDEDLVEQVDTFVRYNQRQNMKFPKESVATILATCKDGDKCNDPNYWGDRTGREIFQKLSDQDKSYLAKQFNIPPEKLEAELVKSMQGKFSSVVVGKVSISDSISDLGLQALGALEVRDEKATQDIRDLLTHAQDKTSQGLKITDIPQRDPERDTVSLTGFLIPESDKTEGRSINLDYAINGDKKDQTALEELAPILAERDRNPIGVSSSIELPYRRRIEPAPNVEPNTIPVPQNESVPAPKVNELAANQRSIERGSKNSSESSSEYISTTKNTIAVEVDTRPIKTTSQIKPETEPETIKPASTANSDLNDSISRAQKALKDYERLKNQAPKDDPMAQAEVDRLRRELDSARQNIEDTKRAISDVRNSRNRAPSSSYDYGSPFGGASSGSGGARTLADPYDPVSIPTAQASISAPEKEGGITSGSVGKSGGLSSDESSGSVAPKGSLTPSQALSSLQGKGVVGGKQGLLAYMFEDVISHRLLMGPPEDVLNMIKILGLEGMNFKTVEALRDQTGDIKYLVRFFSLESADADGVIKGTSSNPLKMCKKPFDDAKERMKAFEQIQSYREKSQDMFLTLVAKNMCIEKEVMIGYDEYQALASHLLDQDKMRQRVYAIAKFRSKHNGKVKRGIASEAE